MQGFAATLLIACAVMFALGLSWSLGLRAGGGVDRVVIIVEPAHASP